MLRFFSSSGDGYLHPPGKAGAGFSNDSSLDLVWFRKCMAIPAKKVRRVSLLSQVKREEDG